jgi:hypothetical protein
VVLDGLQADDQQLGDLLILTSAISLSTSASRGVSGSDETSRRRRRARTILDKRRGCIRIQEGLAPQPRGCASTRSRSTPDFAYPDAPARRASKSTASLHGASVADLGRGGRARPPPATGRTRHRASRMTRCGLSAAAIATACAVVASPMTSKSGLGGGLRRTPWRTTSVVWPRTRAFTSGHRAGTSGRTLVCRPRAPG